MASKSKKTPQPPRTSKSQGPSQPKPSGFGAWLRRTFSHRRLVTGEALLVVGLLDRLGRQWILHEAPLPPAVKVLVLMALVIGVFGGVLVYLERFATGSLSRTHEVVQALPLPTPLIFIHAAAFVGLFLLYGWSTELDVTAWIKEVELP